MHQFYFNGQETTIQSGDVTIIEKRRNAAVVENGKNKSEPMIIWTLTIKRKSHKLGYGSIKSGGTLVFPEEWRPLVFLGSIANQFGLAISSLEQNEMRSIFIFSKQ